VESESLQEQESSAGFKRRPSSRKTNGKGGGRAAFDRRSIAARGEDLH